MEEKKLGLKSVISVSVGLVIATSCLVSLGQGAGTIGVTFIFAMVIACLFNMTTIASLSELNALMPNTTGGLAQYTLACLGPVIAIVLMAVSLFAFVMIVTNLLGYQANLSQAKEKYEQGSYVEAYRKLQGLSIKERDEKLYHQLATLAAVSEKYQAYLVFDNYGSKLDALDALVCAYGRYDLNQKNAKEYGCEDQLEKIGGKIIKALLKDYDMTGDEALDIYQTRKRDDYTVKLHQKLKELGLG